MFAGMPHSFRSYDDLWSSKRFDELSLLLTNWALDRTVSSIDEGFHVERQDCVESGKKNRQHTAEDPPYITRRIGTDRRM